MKCINKSHPDYIALLENSPYPIPLLDAKISIWQDQNDTDEFPTLEQLAQPVGDSKIRYAFKTSTAIINKLDKVKQWYKSLGNTDKFWNKVQQDLQIPKEQVVLVKESEGNTIEEKLASFAANYSYTVEINTAKKKEDRIKELETKIQNLKNSKQFQKLTTEEKAKTIEQVTKEHRSITALKDLAHKLAYRIGGKVEFVNRTDVDWKGYNQGRTSVLNEAYMTPDAPFHEILAHPIIRAIKNKQNSPNNIKAPSKAAFEKGNNRRNKQISLLNKLIALTKKSNFNEAFNILADIVIEADKNNKSNYVELSNFLEEITNEFGYLINDINDVNTKDKKISEEIEEIKTEQKNRKESFDRQLKQYENNTTTLYQSLLKELETGRGKEVLEQVKRDYKYKEDKYGKKYQIDNQLSAIKVDEERNQYDIFRFDVFNNEDNYVERLTEQQLVEKYPNLKLTKEEYTLEEQQEEAIVTLLGMMASDKLDAKKDATLISKLKELWKQISDFVKSLLKQDGIKIDELPITTTLNDLAEIMAYGNNKIILPGYKIEYSTPLGNKYDTLEEVNQEIRSLADANVEVDLSGVNINNELPKSFYLNENDEHNATEHYFEEDGQWYLETQGDTFFHKEKITKEKAEKDYRKYAKYQTNINSFIEKNKEYEQSKEIIEQWKKENNIQYDPEEVYSRGQGFYSSIGAYSNLELDLLLKNLIQHIEDNKKAGGEFTISAFTKPIDKRLKHIEGTGDRVRFVIYPQSEHIKWAAPTDVYSGSVWDAHEKVSKDKKSELLGVSFTKAPALRNINEVSPNLADIIDNLSHAHNELGIELTTNNFRIEYDDNIDYSTKKLIDNINKILDDKYGKLVKPEIKREGSKIETYGPSDDGSYMYVVRDSNNEVVTDFETYQEAENYVRQNITKQPAQTRNNTTSIESVKIHFGGDRNNAKLLTDELKKEIDTLKSLEKLAINKPDDWSINNAIKKKKSRINELNETIDKLGGKKEYTSQAEINLKIAALKEVARKYPRSLITSKVVPINPNMVNNSEIQYSKRESIENLQNELNQLKQELERVEKEGFTALNPIYNFYENTVTNILKKNFKIEKVTDEYGNTWNEVTILQPTQNQTYTNTITSNIVQEANTIGYSSSTGFSSNKKAKAFANKINTKYQDNMLSAVGNTIQFNEGIANQLSIDPDIYPEDIQTNEQIPDINFISHSELNNLYDEINFNLSPDFKQDLNVKRWFTDWTQKNNISFKHYGQLKQEGTNQPPMMQGTAQAMRYRRLILFADESVGWRTMTEEAIHMGLYALWQTDPLLQQIKERKILNLSPNYAKVYEEYFIAYTKREEEIGKRIHDIQLQVEKNNGMPVMVSDAVMYVQDPNDPLIEREEKRDIDSTEYIANLKAFLAHLTKNKGDLIMMEVLAKLMANQVRDEVTGIYGTKADKAINAIWQWFKEAIQKLYQRIFNSSRAADQQMLRDWIRRVSASVVKSEIDLSRIHEDPPPGYRMLNTRPYIGIRATEAAFSDVLRKIGVYKAKLDKYTLQLEKYHINNNVSMDSLITMDGVYALTPAKATTALLDLNAKAKQFSITPNGVQNFNYTFISRAPETFDYINYVADLPAGPYGTAEQNMLTNLLNLAINAETTYLTGMSDPNTRNAFISVLKEEGKNYFDYQQFESDHSAKLQEAQALKDAYAANPNDDSLLDQLDGVMNELAVYDATYENLGVRAHQGKALTRLKAIEERISKFNKEIRDKSFGQAVLWFVLGTDINSPKGAISDYTNMLAQARDIHDNIILEESEISHIVNDIKVFKPMVGNASQQYRDTNPYALFDKFNYEKWVYYRQYLDFNESIVDELQALLSSNDNLDLTDGLKKTLVDAIQGYTNLNGEPVMGLQGYINKIKSFVNNEEVKKLAQADFLFKYGTDPELIPMRKPNESDIDYVIRKKFKINEVINNTYKDQGVLSKFALNPLTNNDPLLNAVWTELFKIEKLDAKLRTDATQAYYKESSRLEAALDYGKLKSLVGSGPDAIVFPRLQNLLIEHENGKETVFLLNKYQQAAFHNAKAANDKKLKQDTEEALSNWGYINYNNILQLAKYNPNHSQHKTTIDAVLEEIKPLLLKYGITSPADVSAIWEQIDKSGSTFPYKEIKAKLQQYPIIDAILKEHNETLEVLDYTDPYAKSTVDFMYSGKYKESDETLSEFLKVLKIDNKSRFNAGHTESEYIEDSDEELALTTKVFQDILTANGDVPAAPSQKSINEIRAWKTNRDKKHIRNLIAYQRIALQPLEFNEWYNKNIEVKYKKSSIGGNHTVALRAKGDLRIPSLSTGDTSYIRKKVDYRVNDDTGEMIPEFEKVTLVKNSYKNHNYDKLISDPAFKAYYAHHKAFYVGALKRVYKPTTFLERVPISTTMGEVFNLGNKSHRVGFQPKVIGREIVDKMMKLVFAIKDTFTYNSDDTFAGSNVYGYADSKTTQGVGNKPLRRVGTHYLHGLKKSVEYTKDIEKSLAMFNEMTIQHQVWGTHYAKVQAMEELIAHRKYTRQDERKKLLDTIRDKVKLPGFDQFDTIKSEVTGEYESNSYKLLNKKITNLVSSSSYGDLNQQSNPALLHAVKILNWFKGYVHLVYLSFHPISQGLAFTSTAVNMSRMAYSEQSGGGKTGMVYQRIINTFINPILRFRFIKSVLDGESRDAVRHLADMAGLYKHEINRGNYKIPQLLGKVPMIGFDVTANVNSAATVAASLYTYKYRKDKNNVFRWMTPMEHNLELAELKKQYLGMAPGPERDAFKAELDLRYNDMYLEAGQKKRYTPMKEVYIYNKKSKIPFAIRSDWNDKFTNSDLAKFLNNVNHEANTAEDQPSNLAFNDINTNAWVKAAFTLFNWLLVWYEQRTEAKNWKGMLGYYTMGDYRAALTLGKVWANDNFRFNTMVNIMQRQSIDPTVRRGVLGVTHTLAASAVLFQMFNALSRLCDSDSWLCNLLRAITFRTAVETVGKSSPQAMYSQLQLQLVMLDQLKEMMDAAYMMKGYYEGDPEAHKTVESGPFRLKPHDKTFIPYAPLEEYVRGGVNNTLATVIRSTPANNIARFGINTKTLDALIKTYQYKSKYINEKPTFSLFGISDNPYMLADILNENKSDLEIKRDKQKAAQQKKIENQK